MCDSFGNQCFYMTMNKNKNASLECSRCDYDCNRTQHTTSLVIRKIDAEKLCSEQRDLDYPMTNINSYISLEPTNHNHNPQLFYLNWKAHLEGKKYLFNQTAHCIWKVKNDFAIVNLYLSTPTIPRMKQDVKHKLHDKLSLLGKSNSSFAIDSYQARVNPRIDDFYNSIYFYFRRNLRIVLWNQHIKPF